jgi:histidinol phosphatase-like PHP family hydrolase
MDRRTEARVRYGLRRIGRWLLVAEGSGHRAQSFLDAAKPQGALVLKLLPPEVRRAASSLARRQEPEVWSSLRKLLPEGAPELFTVRGLPPAAIRCLVHECGVRCLEELDAFLETGGQIPLVDEATRQWIAKILPDYRRERSGDIADHVLADTSTRTGTEADSEAIFPLGLLRREDLQGDLHIHTSITDGKHSPEEMIGEAIRQGHRYAAITDHSRTVGLAGGLTPRMVPAYIRRIRQLNTAYPDIQILAGMEVDILEDGNLDLPDATLAKLDLVIASIHGGFDLSLDQQCRRLDRALRHPLVRILAHPTGRLLGKRSALPIPWGFLVALARETGVCLELNCREERLDAPWELLRLARQAGVGVVISTDAHSVAHLGGLTSGAVQARRAGLTPADVVNTRDFPSLTNWLHDKK